MKENIELINRNELIIRIDRLIFDKVAVLKTCYVFQDKCHLSIMQDNDSTMKVIVIPKKENIDLQLIARRFFDELIDQQIRYENEKLFSDIKKLIVEQAFKPINFSEMKTKIKKI